MPITVPHLDNTKTARNIQTNISGH